MGPSLAGCSFRSLPKTSMVVATPFPCVQGPFILIQELCERLAYNGIATNMSVGRQCSSCHLLLSHHTCASRRLTGEPVNSASYARSCLQSDVPEGRAADEQQPVGHPDSDLVRHVLPNAATWRVHCRWGFTHPPSSSGQKTAVERHSLAAAFYQRHFASCASLLPSYACADTWLGRFRVILSFSCM